MVVDPAAAFFLAHARELESPYRSAALNFLEHGAAVVPDRWEAAEKLVELAS